jgi:hypothetical protein
MIQRGQVQVYIMTCSILLEAGKFRLVFQVLYLIHSTILPPSVLVPVMPEQWDWRVRIQNSVYLMEA